MSCCCKDDDEDPHLTEKLLRKDTEPPADQRPPRGNAIQRTDSPELPAIQRTEVATNNVAKYRVGQRVSQLGYGAVCGVIAEIIPDEAGAMEGPGLLRIDEEMRMPAQSKEPITYRTGFGDAAGAAGAPASVMQSVPPHSQAIEQISAATGVASAVLSAVPIAGTILAGIAEILKAKHIDVVTRRK